MIGHYLKMAATVLPINELDVERIRRPRADSTRLINKMKNASDSSHTCLCARLLNNTFYTATVCPRPPPYSLDARLFMLIWLTPSYTRHLLDACSS